MMHVFTVEIYKCDACIFQLRSTSVMHVFRVEIHKCDVYVYS